MKPALMVIDVQKMFFNENESQRKSLESAVQQIVPAITLFHKKGMPVVFVQHKDEKDNLVPGVEGFNLPDAFDIQPQDIRIIKTYPNSFNKTNLEEKLKALGVDTLILTGFCAEWCVLSTTRGAWDVDMKPILLLGSLASPSAENIRFVESMHEVISFGALESFMELIP